MLGHTNWVHGVAFFNDGCWVVTGSHTKPLRGHQGSVFSVAVSPDDKQIASGGQDSTVIIWDVDSKQIVFKGVKYTESVNCVLLP